MDTSLTLLQSIKKSHGAESWKIMNELYRPMIRRWLQKLDVRVDDVDDLIQEVFLLVMNKIQQFEHEHRVGAFRNWLKKVTLNSMRNYVRKRGNQAIAKGGSEFGLFIQQCEDPNGEPSRLWDEEHEQQTLAYLLTSVRSRFAESTYHAFCETALRGRAPKDVADELNLSVGAVHTAKSRVIAELRRMGQGLID